MFRNIFRYGFNRNFSRTGVWKSTEKTPVNSTPMGNTNSNTPESINLNLGIKLEPWQKKILVWGGKYKTIEEVPERVSYGTYDNAKSRVRIKVSNTIMIVFLVSCAIFVWLGKKKAEAGDTILSRVLKENERIKSEEKQRKLAKES